MSLRLVTPFINTNIPGSYPNIIVQSQPVGLGSSGVVVIMGEAAQGPSYQQIPLKTNYFTPNQLALVTQIYGSGQIVDAFTALAAPSNDPDITGTANQVYVVKTNTGTIASAAIPGGYGTLFFNNYGTPGNNYAYQVTNTQTEVTPTVGGNTVPAFGAPLNGASFTLRMNGFTGAVVTLSATPALHANIGTLITELNGLLPAGITASLGVALNSLQLTMAVDPGANAEGWGKSFELIDSTPGDLASLGLAAGLTVSAAEPAIEVVTSNSGVNFSETLDIASEIGLQIGYQGTTALMTINATSLITTVAGGVGASLNITLSQFNTLAGLVAFIQTQPGYTVSVSAAVQQLSPSILDQVAAIGIASTGTSLMPGRVKIALYNFETALGTSKALVFTNTAHAGLPSSMSLPALLAGGGRGPTLAADIVNALAQMAGINVNIIVPLFSQDASRDITAGMTSSASTYTIAAINALTKSHCIEYSTPQLKKNRQAILSMLDTYANDKSEAQGLAFYRCSLTMQQIQQVNSQGVITTFQPWYASCLAAGMQAGGFYKAIVNKAANIISYIDPVGFDSGDPGDVSDALSAGLLFLSTDTSRAGYWVSDQTTYGYDTNFVYNSIQAVYTSDLVALDLAQSFWLQFGGQSDADVTAASGLAFLGQKMAGYLALKLIGSSSDAPLGWKNPNIIINAPEMDVSVEIKLSTAIYFIPLNINVSQIMNSAS